MPLSGSDDALGVDVRTSRVYLDSAERLSRRALIFTCLGGIAYLILALWAGWSDVVRTLFGLGIGAAIMGLAATLMSYLLRFLRWTLIMRCMGYAPPLKPSLMIYLGGLALTATPGKVGETIRSALLVRFGVPVSASLAAFFVDRLSDLVGVLLLAGLTVGGSTGWIFCALALAALLGGVVLPSIAPHALATIRGAGALSTRIQHATAWLNAASAHIGRAWRPRMFLVLLGVAMIAYGVQGLVFADYASRLWPGLDHVSLLHHFLRSTLVGAASMLPGGIGAMEASLIALLTQDGMPLTSAVAAAIAIRAVTLWFGIALGIASILFGYNRGVTTNQGSDYR
jgi:uncharacterized membrane protein YbhN (UPF0104 family)